MRHLSIFPALLAGGDAADLVVSLVAGNADGRMPYDILCWTGE